MEKQSFIVNLDLPPEKRWQFLENHVEEINELIGYHLSEFEGAELLFEGVSAYKEELIHESYRREAAYLASICNFTLDEILLVNLYYDLLKFYFGCTAFAIEHQDTILHARNMDWVSGPNNLLSRSTRVLDFQKDGKTLFKTVGWFGYLGALSGIKPGKFALTLNAVLSEDEPQVAMPISFYLRDVLESADSFDQAQSMLAEAPIATDCLILLSGTKPGEKVVVERTPKRSALRTTKGNSIIVTNDYKLLPNSESGGGILQETSCSRYDNTQKLIDEMQEVNAGNCMQILQHEKVKMMITVQQMVFDNRSGEIYLQTN